MPSSETRAVTSFRSDRYVTSREAKSKRKHFDRVAEKNFLKARQSKELTLKKKDEIRESRAPEIPKKKPELQIKVFRLVRRSLV